MVLAILLSASPNKSIMFLYFFFPLLAAVNSFSLINDTYDVFAGEFVLNKTVDAFEGVRVSVAPYLTFKFYFFLVVALLISSFLLHLFRLVYWPLYYCFVFCFPKCLIRRYQVLTGTAKRRNNIFAQGEVEPGGSGPSVSLEQAPAETGSMPSVVDPYSEIVVDSKPPSTADASVNGDDTECNGTRNTMFSGQVTRVTLPYRRRRPPSDMVYRSNSSEFNTNALVDSFVISNASVAGSVVYEKSVMELIALSPKFNYIRTLWTYFRFGIKITVQPTVNPMASGVFAASLSSYSAFLAPTISSRALWYVNLGCFPTVYMQCSSNEHAELVVPDVALDRWINNEYIGGASVTSLTTNSLGRLSVFCICPYSANSGGPSQIRYNIFVQLVDIHCKWPQMSRYTAQGIIDINTSVNVIDKMRDSSLPVDMRGGDGAISASGFGFDYPSDPRQYNGMLRRVFQKMHATRGKLDVSRTTFNQCDSSSFPFVGTDEMSIKWLMSRRSFVQTNTLNTANNPFDLITSFRITPDTVTSVVDTPSVQKTLFQLGNFVEFDELVFTFIVPKVPFQNGKYLVTVVSGLGTPPQITSTNVNLSSAPSLVIDLSAPGAMHEFRIPFTLLSEYFPSGAGLRYQRHAIPKLAIYTINPITATLTAPSSVTMSIWRHFENYRVIQPHNNMVTQGGECESTGAKINIAPDSVFTRKVDDGISLKQFMEPFVFAGIYELKLDSLKDCSLTVSKSALIRSLPFGQWYRFWNGSLRLGVQVIPYFDGAPTDRIDQILITLSRRSILPVASPFGKLLNDQPIVPAVQQQLVNFSAKTFSETGGNYFPGYPQFPILLDTTHERMVFLEVPLINPNGYVDLTPADIIGQGADGTNITICMDPIFKGSYVDGTILKTIFWIAAGDDLQGWGFNPMLDGTLAAVAGAAFETIAGVREPLLPSLGNLNPYPF